MASISKMSIRGIRSFSPDRDETIEFYSPLTMIVGANGKVKYISIFVVNDLFFVRMWENYDNRELKICLYWRSSS